MAVTIKIVCITCCAGLLSAWGGFVFLSQMAGVRTEIISWAPFVYAFVGFFALGAHLAYIKEVMPDERLFPNCISNILMVGVPTLIISAGLYWFLQSY